MDFRHTNFGLPMLFLSGVRSRHATDRQTDGQTDTGHHFIMSPPYRGHEHNNEHFWTNLSHWHTYHQWNRWGSDDTLCGDTRQKYNRIDRTPPAFKQEIRSQGTSSNSQFYLIPIVSWLVDVPADAVIRCSSGHRWSRVIVVGRRCRRVLRLRVSD